MSSDDYHLRHSNKKRVGKACDLCRLKKTKCSGEQPCERCLADNKVCIYTERKRTKDKTYPFEYVEMMEKRLYLLKEALFKVVAMVDEGDDSKMSSLRTQLVRQNNGDDLYSINEVISLLFSKDELEAELSLDDEFYHSVLAVSDGNVPAAKKKRNRKSKKLVKTVGSPRGSVVSPRGSIVSPRGSVSKELPNTLDGSANAYPLGSIDENGLGNEVDLLGLNMMELGSFESSAQFATAAMKGSLNNGSYHSDTAQSVSGLSLDSNGSIEFGTEMGSMGSNISKTWDSGPLDMGQSTSPSPDHAWMGKLDGYASAIVRRQSNPEENVNSPYSMGSNNGKLDRLDRLDAFIHPRLRQDDYS